MTGIAQEEEATNNDAGHAPSFFWMAGAGKPNTEAHQQLHPLLSLTMGGTLLLLSLPAVGVRLQQQGWQKGGEQRGLHRRQSKRTLVGIPLFLFGRGWEAGHGCMLMVAPIIVSLEGGHVVIVFFPQLRSCCTVLFLSFGWQGRGS
jgi:hypothetical protein